MVAEEEERLELAQVENTRRIRNNPALYRPFPEVPEVTAWLQLFQSDALRYPGAVAAGAIHVRENRVCQFSFQEPT